MSEARLWDRIRDNIGHMGHFTRLEFNPDSGVPDVDYCIKGVEGRIELKYRATWPRAKTAVFRHHGLRDSQITWIYRRVRHGGRVYILAQIKARLFLVAGKHCRDFNQMTASQIEQCALWANRGREIEPHEWFLLRDALEGKNHGSLALEKGSER